MKKAVIGCALALMLVAGGSASAMAGEYTGNGAGMKGVEGGPGVACRGDVTHEE